METKSPLTPFTGELLWSKIKTPATATAEQYNNGPDNACELIWTDHTNYKPTAGIGEQMATVLIPTYVLVPLRSLSCL